jgi:hypothetical protein
MPSDPTGAGPDHPPVRLLHGVQDAPPQRLTTTAVSVEITRKEHSERRAGRVPLGDATVRARGRRQQPVALERNSADGAYM